MRTMRKKKGEEKKKEERKSKDKNRALPRKSLNYLFFIYSLPFKNICNYRPCPRASTGYAGETAVHIVIWGK